MFDSHSNLLALSESNRIEVGYVPHAYQIRFLLNGWDRTEKVSAATPYDAIKYIQAKYPADSVFAYHVVIVSTSSKR